MEALLKHLAQDLTAKLGRGFSDRNIRQMQLFYLGWPNPGSGSRCHGPTMSGRSVTDHNARGYYGMKRCNRLEFITRKGGVTAETNHLGLRCVFTRE
jgi:hypothetical protein